MVGFLMNFFKIALKLIAKAFKFFGLYWFIIPFGIGIIYEIITGGNSFNQPVINFLQNATWYLSYPLVVLTTIQNIVRFVKRDNTYSVYESIFSLITKRTKAVGFQAKPNLVSRSNLRGFVFGSLKRKYVIKDEYADGHILVIGGAGTGKSSCIAIPTLMSWNERVFAIDVKGELYQKRKERRGEKNLKVFNPSDVGANGYDPFYLLKNSKNLVQSVNEISLSIIPLKPDVKDPYWITQAQSYLTGAILFYYNFELNFSETMMEIKSKPCVELVETIMQSDNTQAKMQMSTFVGMDGKTLSGIYSEVSRHIMPFATDSDLIKALNGEGNCITPNDLEEGYDIFICIKEEYMEQWKALVGMMCNQFLKSFEKREDGNNKPILFLLDEFPRLGKIQAITNGLATLRSKKIEIALFVQSKSQLNLFYGKEEAEVIADNCTYKAILGAGDTNTQEWCSKLVGTYDKKKLSSNYNTDVLGVGKGAGTSTTTEEKRIIKPEEFAYLQDIVCIFPTGYLRVNKTSCYEDGAFKS